jgi:microcystin-dependent protein
VTDQFVAEIRIFPFNFAPTGWAFCDGQVMPISQNTALFSLLGTNYGGDGISNFALPNLQGSAAMFYEQGPGLSNHNIGEAAGEQAVTLTNSTTPAHQHAVQVFVGRGGTNSTVPAANTVLAPSQGGTEYDATVPAPAAVMDPNTIAGSNEAGLPHNNLMPTLVFNFCIALQGIFPPRS